ncbi:DUF2203 domain-containing protein [Silvibacterium dinghuense]|uniref:DUF2203 family protein n=1 Tax=Silvibacterium dinghuense TaxID=1560006 RepID=A0A4Q1SE44_9BACT|nr:DUF2203 domain-containing protein [Silvibacterium dinghuense]RXS95524.1 DUF2203 family protein [Silvibacterium dinghuense]GGH13758.1 hypothetical protein GCM10011586_33830 [Silvibacterium dinghuense]
MKTFTLEEAQSLLPVVESLLRRATESRRQANSLEERLQALTRRIMFSGGMRVDVAKVGRDRAQMETHVQQAKDALEEIDAIGVQIKDLDTGLLDFPCEVDGEIVLLCWRMGEARIDFWHTLDAGFRGRQPIDDRFRPKKARDTKPERPN